MAWDQHRRGPSDYLHPAKRARVIAEHNGICHLCGHPGATQVDHVIPWAQWQRADVSVHDKGNLRPAHGSPCPTCGRDCHAEKTKAEAAAGRRAGNARRQQLSRRPTEAHPGALTQGDHDV